VWCFQERLLAVRTLHFATNQMYWECAETFEEESGVDFTKDSGFYTEYSMQIIADSLNLVDHSFYNRPRKAWFRMIQEYTSRTMTYQSDKLPALSGVIGVLQDSTGDVCLAGIWKSWFLEGLLWRLQDPVKDIYVFAPKQPYKINFWRAPSWSFAALEGVVLNEILEHASNMEICAELEDCKVVPSGSNALGELKSGYAKIKAPLTTLTVTAQKNIGHASNGLACTVRLREQRRVYAGVSFDIESHETCDVVMIAVNAGLAIRPVDLSKGTYVRIGLVSIYKGEGGLDSEGRELDLGDRTVSLQASDYSEPISITLI
jgi:hypothetical protein